MTTITPPSPHAVSDVQNEALLQLRLLSWMSPSFPTGAFAYSHGLEWAVEQGTVRDLDTLVAWLRDLLLHGTGRTDAILVRHAYRSPQGELLRMLADEACAVACARERLQETTVQGVAFARAASVWLPLPSPIDPDAEEDWPLPVVLGAIFRAAGFDEERTVLAALHGFCATLVSAAVRLIPLGQTDGLRALAATEDAVTACAERTRTVSLDDLGGFCLNAELAAMRHETQFTRLFRS